jgi:hypothetical protein
MTAIKSLTYYWYYSPLDICQLVKTFVGMVVIVAPVGGMPEEYYVGLEDTALALEYLVMDEHQLFGVILLRNGRPLARDARLVEDEHLTVVSPDNFHVTVKSNEREEIFYCSEKTRIKDFAVLVEQRMLVSNMILIPYPQRPLEANETFKSRDIKNGQVIYLSLF